MISDYANYSCTIRRPSLTNTQGEQALYDIGIESLPVFLITKEKYEETDRGWILLYDALGFVDKDNIHDYEPLIGDKWVFGDAPHYEITDVQPLRGLGNTQYGFQVELLTISLSGVIT